MSLELLPNEIVLDICKHLWSIDLIRFGQTSKRFYNVVDEVFSNRHVAIDDQLFTFLKSFDELSDHVIIGVQTLILRRFGPTLKSIGATSYSNDFFCKYMSSSEFAARLAINCPNVEDLTSIPAQDTFKYIKRLDIPTSLVKVNVPPYNYLVEDYFQPLRKCTNLSELHLNLTNCRTSECRSTIESLAKLSNTCKRYKTLSITTYVFCIEHFYNALSRLDRHDQTLKEIHLHIVNSPTLQELPRSMVPGAVPNKFLPLLNLTKLTAINFDQLTWPFRMVAILFRPLIRTLGLVCELEDREIRHLDERLERLETLRISATDEKIFIQLTHHYPPNLKELTIHILTYTINRKPKVVTALCELFETHGPKWTLFRTLNNHIFSSEQLVNSMLHCQSLDVLISDDWYPLIDKDGQIRRNLTMMIENMPRTRFLFNVYNKPATAHFIDEIKQDLQLRGFNANNLIMFQR